MKHYQQTEIPRAKDMMLPVNHSPLLKNIWLGVVVGIFTGLVVVLFRWIIDQTLILLTVVYPFMRQHPTWLIPYVLGTVIVVFLIAYLVRPYAIDLIGSGVPQIKAILAGRHKMNWWQVLWRKFIAGLLTICPGLFLGREGPCIQIGACIGQGVNQHFSHEHDQQNLFIACGAAAGLSAAFSAPVAGAVFLLEEISHNFKARIWVPALAASISADLMTFIFFGTKPCLYLPLHHQLPLQAYPWLILIGLVIGGVAYLFQYCLFNLKWWYRKFTVVPQAYHSILPLLLVIPVGLWNPRLLGGSHNLIVMVTNFSLNHHWLLILGTLIVFAVLRFVGTMIAYGAAVPGGIFMPIFVIGSLLGAIAGIILVHAGMLDSSGYLTMIALGMAAFFAATEGTPFSAILLVTEMVGSIEQILPMTILVFIAYYTSIFLGAQPSLYDALLQNMNFDH